jgi:hypothetical protein
MIKYFLSLLLLMCCITFIDLSTLNRPCIPGMKPTWLWWMIFLLYCWIQFAIILLRIFALMFIREIGCSSPFWRCLCLVLGWMKYWLYKMS